jgi:UrcA family protein
MGETKIAVSQRVSFADLDFSRQADVNMLRERVKAAARESCLELERRFPPSIYVADNDRHACIRDATREGIAQAMIMLQEKAIAQARGPAEARARLSVIR